MTVWLTENIGSVLWLILALSGLVGMGMVAAIQCHHAATAETRARRLEALAEHQQTQIVGLNNSVVRLHDLLDQEAAQHAEKLADLVSVVGDRHRRTRRDEDELMDTKHLSVILDALAASESMLADPADRNAARRLAEGLRDRWTGRWPVNVVLVAGPDADPVAWQLEKFGHQLDEARDWIGGLGDTAETLLDEVRERRQRLTAERDALRAMVDGCREIVADHAGVVDGDRAIDEIAAVVGYPERTEEAG